MDHETLCLISLNAYHRISKDSFFRRPLRKDDVPLAKNTLVFLGFSELLHLSKERKDYFLILKTIENDVDGVYEMLKTGEKEKFEESFEKLKTGAKEETLNKFEKYFAEEEKKI